MSEEIRNMKMSIKQEELADELYKQVKKVFPEIKFKQFEVSPDDPEHIWIIVDADIDDDRMIELNSYSSKLEIEILLNYGYALSIMAENPNAVYA